MSQQKKSNALLYVGLAAAGGVGYYLYSAGGNPKVAEKNFESMSLCDLSRFIVLNYIGDLSKASAKVKSELPGRGTEAQKDAEKWSSQAGAKVDSAVSDSNLPSRLYCHQLCITSASSPHSLFSNTVSQVHSLTEPRTRSTKPASKLQRLNNTAKMPRPTH